MKIIDLLLRNPILLFVLGAWLVSMISSVLKKQRARASRPSPRPASRPAQQTQLPTQSQRTLPQQSIPSQAQPMPARTPIDVPSSAPRPAAAKTAEEVAREMRRILGLEPDPPKPAPRPVVAPAEPPPVRRAPIAPPIERPPQPIQISTRDRRLELHVDPHVGDGIRDRHLQKSRRRQPADRLGNLGGRVVEHAARRRAGSRFALDDVKRAIVLSEILAPPVSLRPFEERRGH